MSDTRAVAPISTNDRAEAMFEAERTFLVLEESIFDDLFKIMELPDICTNPWPFSNWWHDSYDSSFELGGVAPDFRMKPEWLSKIWDLGFYQFWLNHQDGSETFYYRRGEPTGSRKEGGLPRECGAEARNTKRLRQDMRRLFEALQLAEAQMTSHGGCVCGCSVIDGHTATCPVAIALHPRLQGIGCTPSEQVANAATRGKEEHANDQG